MKQYTNNSTRYSIKPLNQIKQMKTSPNLGHFRTFPISYTSNLKSDLV